MKKLLRLLLVSLLTVSLLMGVVACQRPEPKSEMEQMYDLAVEAGFVGNYEDWLGVLTGVPGAQGEKGADGAAGADGADGAVGDDGLSAYEIYCRYHPAYKGTEEQWINALSDGSLMASYTTHYNIIFALATIPPVLSSLDAIESGYETYACIERGKTYNGIAALPAFHNVSFDTSSNKSDGFTNEQFDAMVETMRELNVFGNEKFHIYVQDATGIAGFGLAANAGLLASQYDIVLCEDGTGAYYWFEKEYIADKTVSADRDEPYELFAARVEQTRKDVASVLSRTDNRYTDYAYDLPRAATLATLDGVTYWYQDAGRLANELEKSVHGEHHSKLLSVFDIEGYDDAVDFTVNLRYDSISEMVGELDEAEKSAYLKLMYGNAYEGTYAALTRTTLDDGTTPVPSDKLVYIGTRVKGFPKVASDAKYGIGGLGEGESVPASYAELNPKYKNPLIFGTEADYALFLAELNNNENYTRALSADEKAAVARDAFHYYIDYAFTMKFTYAMYGEDYDIIVKGHPSEVLGNYANWTSHYQLADGGYVYDKLINSLAEAFHAFDSTGRMIGTMPYGTAAENLAYLGVPMAIGGLPSSTYAGYEPSIDVKFVFNLIDGGISADDNLKARYEGGTLKNHDESGNECDTEFYNVGYFYLSLVTYYDTIDADSYASIFEEKLDAWLRTQNGLGATDSLEGYGVDAQGFLIKPGTP